MKTDVPTLHLISAVVLSALAGGCVVREVGLDVGREHLATIATVNYDFRGGERIERLIDLLVGPAGAPEGADAGSPDPAGGAFGPVSPAIRLDLTCMRELQGGDGRRVLAPIEDGDVLLDGHLRAGAGDGFKLRVQVDRPCHVYVILVDATARPWQLFPQAEWSSVDNPLQGERPYRMPEGNILYPLGATRGIETLWVVASAEPFTELEALMAELGAADWSGEPPPAPVQRALRLQLGVAGEAPSLAPAVVAPSGALSDVPSRRYDGRPGERVVVTRWFRHR